MRAKLSALVTSLFFCLKAWQHFKQKKLSLRQSWSKSRGKYRSKYMHSDLFLLINTCKQLSGPQGKVAVKKANLKTVHHEFTCSPPENTLVTPVFTFSCWMHTIFKRMGLKTHCARGLHIPEAAWTQKNTFFFVNTGSGKWINASLWCNFIASVSFIPSSRWE